ncbi:MAG: elongation factor P [Candidatus Lambdaproteobacteria bacterium RIFOXYD2_FULL_50_16]|uniref:Elongation factor P n=1 Tax=Candidatus Lambdaproteobacteria bacterium RIFOXYD2_FULL_50_16 TaxID=1817772 RepID=A0A1F6GAQ3_9PROT|nr:MAG: elongation factor P [Candidatus Lambdaproteobacteria bacterium RIFOXYD2_FULL_50_16]
MYNTNEFKKGLRIEMDGVPYTIVENQFVKPGKGQAFNRVKIKNLLNGNVIERTLKSGEKVDKADVIEREMQYLYPEGDKYVFMDTGNYEQTEMSKEQLGEEWKWLLEQMLVQVIFYKGQPITLTLPNFVEMEITYCEPGLKGDTATNTLKPATMSTGAQVMVPLFITQGERIRVDTRTGEYMERAKS